MCRPLIVIDSVFKSSKSYYLQILLEECKYKTKKKKSKLFVTDDLERIRFF